MPALDDPALILICVLQFTTVSLLIWSLFRFRVPPEPPVNRQIAIALGLGQRQTVFENSVMAPLLSIPLLLAKRFPYCRQRIRTDLETSGNPSGYSVDEYLAICLAAGVGLGVLSYSSLLVTMGQHELMLLVFMPVLGFYLPLISLKDMAEKRKHRISRQLPYTLDLIGLLMGAGANFTEAMHTLIKDDPEDDLNIELKLVLSEIEFGTTRSVALRKMADRIPLDSLRSTVGAIVQAENLGTPLSVILKNQAIGIRQRRSVAAEEASAKASTRILVPSMLILVAVVILIFGPVIMDWRSGRMTGALGN